MNTDVSLWLAILLFAVGLVCLIKGGDWFVRGAVDLANKLNMPEILVGATVVSIGTTLPEVMVSATSAIEGIGAMSYGNAIGSIICNTALIAALTVAIKPSKADPESLKQPLAFFFAAAGIYLVISYFVGRFDRWVGILLLAMFAAYIFVNVRQAVALHASGKEKEDEAEKTDPLWMMILLLVAGAALIAVGAKLLVDYGTAIAVYMGVPASVIALTFVALGTSLPELVTAVVSLAKGHGSLSLGNIIGANLFNLVLVNGVSVTLAPYRLPAEKLLFGKNAALVLDLPLMVLVMLILTIPALVKGRLSRTQGITLLAIYAGFVVIQFL